MIFTCIVGQLPKRNSGQGALCQLSPLLTLETAKMFLAIIFLLIFTQFYVTKIIFLFTVYIEFICLHIIKIIHAPYTNSRKYWSTFNFAICLATYYEHSYFSKYISPKIVYWSQSIPSGACFTFFSIFYCWAFQAFLVSDYDQ